MAIIHGQKSSIEDIKEYIESKGCKLITKEYINQKQKLKIICECGNEFEKSFLKFKYANQIKCHKCALKSRADKRRMDLNYIKNFAIENNNKILSEKYTNSYDILDIECSCGNVYKQSWAIYKNSKHLCESCLNEISRNRYRHTDDYIKNSINNNGVSLTTFVTGKYDNVNSKIILKCECGDIYEQTYGDFKASKFKVCKKCMLSKKHLYNKIDIIKIINNIESNSKCKVICSNDFINTQEGKLKIKCNCGKVFKSTYRSFMGSRLKVCPHCVSKYLKDIGWTDERILNYFKDNYKEVEVLNIDRQITNYSNGTKSLRIRLKLKKGNKTKQINFSQILRDGLKFGNESFGEKIFASLLNDNAINYESQKYFKDLKEVIKEDVGVLKFDFYLPDYNVCVEIDGLQHKQFVSKFHVNEEGFIRQQYRDKIKEQYCYNKNIKLFRIDTSGYIGKRHYIELKSKLSEIIENILRDAPNG